MARISDYPSDITPEGSDILLGNGANGGITKVFSLENLSEWMSNTGKVTIVGQNNFAFQTEGLRQDGTVSFENYGGANTSFASINTLVFSARAINGIIASTFMATLVGKQVVLARLDNQNNYGIYTLQQFSPRGGEPGFYDAQLVLVSSNGEITANKYYGFAGYTSNTGGGGGGDDKSFVYTQSVASATWNITHNLGKYPSVSVTDSGLSTVYGDVDYTDTNSLTITFKSAFGGKAFLN